MGANKVHTQGTFVLLPPHFQGQAIKSSKVCHDYVAAAEQILSLVQVLSGNLPRLELYERLHDDPQFKLSLVEVFSDVLEFAVAAYRFINRRTHGICATTPIIETRD